MIKQIVASAAVIALALSPAAASAAQPNWNAPVGAPVTSQQPSPAPLDRFCADWTAGNTFTVEAMGDSIVKGEAGASTPTNRWPHQLNVLLQARGGALWNAAQNGATIVDFLPGGPYYYHTEFARAVKPTVVLWNFRVNDQARHDWGLPGGSSPSELRDRYVQLAAHLRETSPSTTIVLVNSPKVIAAGWPPAWEQEYVAAIKQAKNLIPGSLLVDLSDYSPSYGEGDPVGLMDGDGLHQSDRGQRVTVGAVHQRFRATCER